MNRKGNFLFYLSTMRLSRFSTFFRKTTSFLCLLLRIFVKRSIFSLVKKITGHESQYGSMVLLFPSEEREWRLPQGPLPEPVVTLRTKQWHGSHDRCQIMHHPFDWRLSPRGFGRANHGEIWDIMDTWLVKKVLKSRKTLLLWPCCVNQ